MSNVFRESGSVKNYKRNMLRLYRIESFLFPVVAVRSVRNRLHSYRHGPTLCSSDEEKAISVFVTGNSDVE